MILMIAHFDSGLVGRIAASFTEVAKDAETLVSEGVCVSFCDDLQQAKEQFGEIQISNPVTLAAIEESAVLEIE